MSEFILAIDQGTTGSRAALIDRQGRIVADAYQEFTQILPQPGHVEHDANEIWQSVTNVMQKAVGDRWPQVASIGITNQRETTVLWSRKTSQPIHNAIVWQDRRTADRCAQLAPNADDVQQRTGLVIDAYFSATKLEWLLKNVSGAHHAAKSGDLAFGTIDSWLVWKLTAAQSHITDFTNASRTMLYNIHERQWDNTLLNLFNIPKLCLPQVKKSSEIVGHTDPKLTAGRSIPIAGIVGDQQGALFGQCAWEPGQAKNTYGTGAFLLMNVGPKQVQSKHRLLVTLACDRKGEPTYALEGSIFIAGASIQWLRDGLGIIGASSECDALARTTTDNAGVYFVPALVGLGAPHWRSDVRGAIFGLTRGANRAHLVRAALEAMAYQSREVIEAMQNDAGVILSELATDGGASRNDWLMQFQSNVLNVPVRRAENVEMTAIGAAYLAGLATGFWKNADELAQLAGRAKVFTPHESAQAANTYKQWRNFEQTLLHKPESACI